MYQNKIGLAWIKEQFMLDGIKIDGECFAAKIASINKEDVQCYLYPESYRPKDTVVEHLKFALKYEPLNLRCLSDLFKQADIDKELEQALASSPASKYNRLIGFYYEFLTKKSLKTQKLLTGNYIDAVNKDSYYVAPSIKEKKFRVNNNLTGNSMLSMLIHRNEKLLKDEELKLLLIKSVSGYPVEFLDRATRYLISKETKSSHEIEAESVSPNKLIKFIFALETINNEELTKEKLLDTLNIIKEKHYHEFDYRVEQNYLGDSGFNYIGSIDYVPPKPFAAHELMEQWFLVRDKVLQSDMPSIAKAAVLSSSFVFIHPFMDGNGRISRYIMQDTLYRMGLIDNQYSLPLSSGILLELRKYYNVLNEKSRKIMAYVDFFLDDNGKLTVNGDTADLYRHLSFDSDALFLSDIAKKVTQELVPEEIEKLKLFDAIFQGLKENIDLPNTDMSLITTLLIQNKGKISIKKRKGVLSHLHTESLNYAEQVYEEILDDSRLS